MIYNPGSIIYIISIKEMKHLIFTLLIIDKTLFFLMILDHIF